MSHLKFHRTSAQAFPRTVEYGAAIIRTRSRISADSWVMYTCGVAFVFVVVMMLMGVV